MIQAFPESREQIRQEAMLGALDILTHMINLSTPPEEREVVWRDFLLLCAQRQGMAVQILTRMEAAEEMTIASAAALLEVTEDMLYRYHKRGQLPARKWNGQIWIKRAALLALRVQPKAQRPGQKGVA